MNLPKRNIKNIQTTQGSHIRVTGAGPKVCSVHRQVGPRRGPTYGSVLSKSISVNFGETNNQANFWAQSLLSVCAVSSMFWGFVASHSWSNGAPPTSTSMPTRPYTASERCDAEDLMEVAFLLEEGGSSSDESVGDHVGDMLLDVACEPFAAQTLARQWHSESVGLSVSLLRPILSDSNASRANASRASAASTTRT